MLLRCLSSFLASQRKDSLAVEAAFSKCWIVDATAKLWYSIHLRNDVDINTSTIKDKASQSWVNRPCTALRVVAGHGHGFMLRTDQDEALTPYLQRCRWYLLCFYNKVCSGL